MPDLAAGLTGREACLVMVLTHDAHRLPRLSPDSSRTNTDDRLSLGPLGRVEGGDGIVEGSHVADVCPHSFLTSPPDNLTQLGAIGYDDEVNCCLLYTSPSPRDS